jgi:hypothetical protein
MFQTKVVEKIKTHNLFSVIFLEDRAVCKKIWKNYSRAGQVTDDNMAQALCMLDA